MSLTNPSLEHVYCSITVMSNHVIIRLIRFVSRFTAHLCNAIYFLTTFSTSCKRFTKILHFVFWNLNKASMQIGSWSKFRITMMQGKMVTMTCMGWKIWEWNTTCMIHLAVASLHSRRRQLWGISETEPCPLHMMKGWGPSVGHDPEFDCNKQKIAMSTCSMVRKS